jgi:hypothetical protein
VIRYVDFDGTLVTFNKWEGPNIFGKPVPYMIQRVKKFIKSGDKVVIFTARLTPSKTYDIKDVRLMRRNIENWCVKNLGAKLRITNTKGNADVIYDDRCQKIIRNTGLTEAEFLGTILKSELKSKRSKKESINRVLKVLMES